MCFFGLYSFMFILFASLMSPFFLSERNSRHHPMPPLLWLLWLCQKPRHHPLRPTFGQKTEGLQPFGRSRLRPYGTKGAYPMLPFYDQQVRHRRWQPKVATGNSHCELLGEACNNGVLASSACSGLMTSTLGSHTIEISVKK